jgi:PAS domain-containing protein
MNASALTHQFSKVVPAFESILNGLPDAILLLDQDGSIVWFNAASQTVLKLGQQMLELRDIFTASDIAAKKARLDAARSHSPS